jgi:hypothetical protein
MGKACIRFKRAADLPLDVIGDLVAGVSPEAYIAVYEKSRALTAGGRKAAAREAAGRKPAVKRTAKAASKAKAVRSRPK